MTENLITADGAKALIFDCDGTLVDSMPLHMRAWRHTFKRFSAAYDEEFLYALRGMKETEIILAYNRRSGSGLDPDALVREKHRYFMRHISEVRPIESVARLAREKSGVLPLAVVSGSRKRIVHRELTVTGLKDLFAVILTADDPFTPKPAPDIFLEAARRMKVDPGDCHVFEDGDPGMAAAHAAGMAATDIRMYI